MHYKSGMTVYTADNEKVGSVKQVVLDPRDQTVSHLIIERGFLFTTERVLPVGLIATGDEERLILKADEHDFENLPEFQEREYIPVDDVYDNAYDTNDEIDAVPAMYGTPYYYYGAPGYSPWYYGPGVAPISTPPQYVTREVENIPENSIALDIGSRVTSRDDKHVGDLDEVFTDNNGHVTHFVISQGFLFTTRKVVPVGWISTVSEDEVFLSVNSDVLNRLPDYESVR